MGGQWDGVLDTTCDGELPLSEEYPYIALES